MRREKENNFRFKQFQIIQNQSVHRVGTDGVLLGAWANITPGSIALDIGTGTGLIALMLAQRGGSSSSITAIEPNQAAFDLACQNAKESPFSNQIKVIHTSLESYQSTDRFDLIVCNPPFFEKSLKPPGTQRAQARHSESLPFVNLIEGVKRLMKPDGCLAIILPVNEGNRFAELAVKSGLAIKNKCAIISKQNKPQERWLLEFTLGSMETPTQSELIIQAGNGNWTESYRNLTRDFYLNF